MGLYQYGVGGNEVKVDANESIAEIPSNRTLFVQKLTDEAPVNPEAVYGLETVEDIFERFNPTVQLEHQDQEGTPVVETMSFHNLGDFGAKNLKENSPFLSQLDVEKEQYVKIARQLSSNRALLKAVENAETRSAMIELLEKAVEEISKSNPSNEE